VLVGVEVGYDKNIKNSIAYLFGKVTIPRQG
jgi:hypothetical protein